jgi:hypothetical protein
MKFGSKMKTIKVTISSIVDGGICLAASDGQKVHAALHKIVAEGNRAEISFFGVSRMTTAFLNAAVGQLYGEFDEGTLKARLAPPVDFEDWHLKRLKLVVERAKSYFEDQERIDKIYKDNLKEA